MKTDTIAPVVLVCAECKGEIEFSPAWGYGPEGGVPYFLCSSCAMEQLIKMGKERCGKRCKEDCNCGRE